MVPVLTNQYVFATYGVIDRPRLYSANPYAPAAPTRLTNSALLDLSQAAGWNANQLIMSLGDDWSGDSIFVVVVDTTFPGTVTANGSVWRLDP
jgi:hypothetical protein